jgi:starch phosphorylase
MVAADFDSYCAQQEAVESVWRAPRRWWRSASLNTAGVGWFSSDRTIAEYADDIWQVPVRRPLASAEMPQT